MFLFIKYNYLWIVWYIYLIDKDKWNFMTKKWLQNILLIHNFDSRYFSKY